MPKSPKSDSRSEIRLAARNVGPGAVRTAERTISRLEKQRRGRSAAAGKELDRLRRDYLKELTVLVGRPGMRELDLLRTRGKLTRAQKIRRSLALLEKSGVAPTEIRELSRPYLVRSRDILSAATGVSDYALPLAGDCDSPWVTYRAPFSGYAWSYSWDRTSGPANPVLNRYLDASTGAIGSSIDVKDTDAGNDDKLSADYYTGLNVWHTPLSSGALEVYLVFEFNSATYSGKIEDEFGFSDITYTQGAAARMLATDVQNPIQTDDQSSGVYGFTEFIWGEDDFWDRQVARPRDYHAYFFRTAANFEQGSTVLLEAGISQMAWFWTNDESVKMSANLDLRLDRIMVRSCQDIFL